MQERISFWLSTLAYRVTRKTSVETDTNDTRELELFMIEIEKQDHVDHNMKR